MFRYKELSTLRKLILFKKLIASGIKVVSGAIASFVTKAAGKAISVLDSIEPIQEGSGTPSPTNIRPISGRTEVVTSRVGKNWLDVSATTHNVYNIGSIPNTLLPNKQYTFSINGTTDKRYRLYLAKSTTPLNAQVALNAGYLEKGNSETFTTPSDFAEYDRLCLAGINGAGNEDLSLILPQVELGTTATDYEPYNGTSYTTDLGQTVYGGTLDVVSGVLTVDRAMVDLGDLNWIYDRSGYFQAVFSDDAKHYTSSETANAICSSYAVTSVLEATSRNGYFGIYYYASGGKNYIRIQDEAYTDATAFKTAVSGQTLVYELATPQTIQLTPQEVALLKGTNNLWCDSGDIEVTYKG